MPAAEKERVNPGETLGIIAGGGPLPGELAASCERDGIKPFLIAFKGQTDPKNLKGRDHVWLQLRTAGHVPDVLRERNIKNIVMIGAIRRPNIFELIPDLKTAKLVSRIGLNSLGDNGLLSGLRSWLEEEGLRIRGIHTYMTDLLTPEGVLGTVQPAPEDFADIKKGLEISQTLGALDIGQSAIVQQGIVLGLEGIEGTDNLIRRCGRLKRRGRGPILVKTCKPQQDRDLDLPVIGLRTIRSAVRNGFSGIVLHAGSSMIINRAEVIAAADKAGIFILGAHP
jgi:DUF1009 family protein